MNSIKVVSFQWSSWLQVMTLMLVLLAGNDPAHHGRAAAQDPETLNLALDSGALNSLVDTIKNDLIPDLAEGISAITDEVSSTSVEGSCCGVGDIGVKSTARIFDFSLGSVNQNDLGVVARDTVFTDNFARLGIQANNVGLQAKVETGVGAAFLVPLTCFIGATATISIPRVEFLVDITIEPGSDGQVVNFGLGELNLPFVNVVLFPIIDNVCSAVSAILSLTFTALSFALSQLLLPILRGVIASVIEGQFATQFDLGELVPGIEVFNGTTFKPEVGFPRVQSNAGLFQFGISTKFISSILTEPDFRAGRSFVKEIPTSILLPGATPTPPAFASAHLGFRGVNNLIESFLYLAWASIATDPQSLDSVLCERQTSLNDPCPFPPVGLDPGFWGTILLILLFLFNNGPGGIFRGYRISAALNSPALDFQDNVLQVKSRAFILVEGLPLFGFLGLGSNAAVLEIAADAVVEATLPVYDSVTGLLGNVNLANVELQDPVFDFKKGEPLFGLGTNLVFDIIASVFNGVADVVFVIVNGFLKAFLDANPFKIPLIPNFPLEGKAIQITIQGTTINGVAGGPGTDGFLDIDAGVQVDVIEFNNTNVTETTNAPTTAPTDAPSAAPTDPSDTDPTDPPDPTDDPDGTTGNIFQIPRSSDNSIYTASAYKRAYETTLEWNNPDATYTTSFSDPVSGEEERCMFRLSGDDEEGDVQVRCYPEDDWRPAPAPVD